MSGLVNIVFQADTVFSHTVPYGHPVNTQKSGGCGFVASADSQCFNQGRAFKIIIVLVY